MEMYEYMQKNLLENAGDTSKVTISNIEESQDMMEAEEVDNFLSMVPEHHIES